MNATASAVEFLVDSNEAHAIELLPEPQRLKAYREIEAWAGLKADQISKILKERKQQKGGS